MRLKIKRVCIVYSKLKLIKILHIVLQLVFFGLIAPLNADTFCDVSNVELWDTLNVREKPNPSSGVVATLAPTASSYKDTQQRFSMLECILKSNKNSWCKIIVYQQNEAVVGWINAKYVECFVENHAPVDN